MEYVSCKICNKKFKQITPTHLQKEHNITIQDYREKFPDAKLRVEQVRKIKSNQNIKSIIEFLDLEEYAPEFKNLDPEIISLQNISDSSINNIILKLLPEAKENYMINIFDINNKNVIYQFMTDIAIPSKKIILDFPNSFFHNTYSHTDILRNQIIPTYGWKIITIKQKNPSLDDILEELEKNDIRVNK